MLRCGRFGRLDCKRDRRAMGATGNHRIPEWARWCAVAWLAVWVPCYWRFWGFSNFVHLCDAAVSSLLIDSLWTLDALWRLLTHHHLIGGTEYLFDMKYPLWIRALSLFHLLLPAALILALRRTGYDRRGWLLQCGIAAGG